MVSSVKPQKDRVRRASGAVTHGCVGRLLSLERTRKLHAPAPYLARRISSVCLFLSYALS